MRFIYQLILLRFVSPKTLFLFFRAKRIHGNNLSFLLKLAADRFGIKIAIADEQRRLSFAELHKKVAEISSWLKKNIIAEDNATIILACSNSVSHIAFLHAIQNLGLKVILVNHKAHTAEINRIAGSISAPYYFFSSDTDHLLLPNAHNIDDVFSDSNTADSDFIPSKKHAPVIFPTSGTTGNAKLIEKRTGAFYWLRSFAHLSTNTGIYKRKAVYISIPVSHGFGYTALMFALVLGKKAIITPNKNQQLVTELLLNEKTDLIAGVPSSLFQVAENLKGKQHFVTLIISGGAPLNEVAFKSITENLTTNIYSMYGSTEASTSFIADYAMLKQNIHALGKPLKGVNYKLGAFTDGSKELLIQSPLANLSTDEWLHSGDLADVDSNGILFWCGRKDNMILKNGVNIYPAEIEKAMHLLDGIEDVHIAGEEDALKGEIIIAYIITKAGFLFNEEQTRSQLAKSLPAIKIPDKIVRVQEFNYTSTGKKVNPVL